jgi:biopolymer transport protein ExbD
MSGSVSSESNAEPNLTPMLDMVFQLITFFMLVSNFKAASLDLSLKLPVVGSARPVDTKGAESLLILNIDKDGDLNVYGYKREVEPYIAGEAKVSRNAAKQMNSNFKPGDELPETVVVRADKASQFHLVHNVITICQNQGYRKFALKAMNKAE